MNIPILMYHGIHDVPGQDGRFEPVYSITRRQFERQLAWLADNGYQSVTCARLEEWNSDARIVVITFDDGDLSNYTVSLPLLQKYGMCADYFITTDWIDSEEYMSPNQLRELDRAGMSVQSHARSHRYLSDLTAEELSEELNGSREVLEQILGKPVTGLALPGGRGGERVVRMARDAGYRYVCSSELGVNSGGGNRFALQRIPVTRQMELEQFARLVTGDRWEIGRRVLRQRILGRMKKLLGNRLYERLRSRVVES